MANIVPGGIKHLQYDIT